MYRSPPSDARAEWYYRLDGREHGPMSAAALQEMAGASGETAAVIEVRRGKVGDWIPYASAFTVPAAIRLASKAAEISHPAVRMEKSAREPAFSALSLRKIWALLRGNGEIVAAIVVWALVNAVVLGWWSLEYRTERRYAATLHRLAQRVAELRSRAASAEEWNALRKQVKEQLDPMVSDLKRSASASQPIRQHLLWAARDHFPAMVGPSSAATKEAEQHFRQHMQIAEEQLTR